MLLTLCILALAALGLLALLGGVALIAYFSALAGGQVVRVLGLACRGRAGRQRP